MTRMIMKRKTVTLGVVALAGAGLFTAAYALASGAPATEPLTYSGVLETAGGAPLTGDHTVEVRFHDDAAAGAVLCTSAEQAVTLDGGRFSVRLPNTCADAVSAHADLWVEIPVDATSLGRAKAGAVPYALEADHATTSDIATTATNATNATNVVTNVDGTGRKICTGTTPLDTTAWEPYPVQDVGTFLTVPVDTSECGFTQTPRYFTTLGGNNAHWSVVGATNIYSATATGFRVYLYSQTATATANAYQWHIEWMAVGE
jgi:hypothetical protein